MKRELSSLVRACMVLLVAFPVTALGQQTATYPGSSFNARVLDSPRANGDGLPSYGLPGIAAQRTSGREMFPGRSGATIQGSVPGAAGGRTTAESFLLFQKMIDAPVSAVGDSRVVHDAAGRVTRLGDAPVEYNSGGRVTRFAGESVNYDNSGRIIRFGGKIVHHDSNGRPVMVGQERLGYDSSGRLRFIGKDRVDYDHSGRIVRIGGEPLSYDTQGRLQEYRGKRIEYRR